MKSTLKNRTIFTHDQSGQGKPGLRKIALAAALFATTLLFIAQPAKTQDTAAVVSGIQKKYASINDLKSPFTQVTRIKDLEEKMNTSAHSALLLS